MRYLIYASLFTFTMAACSGGTVQLRNSPASAAVAMKIDTSQFIAHVYLQKGNTLYKSQTFDSYYVFFNLEPGTYVLSHGETVMNSHYFSDAMKKDCTVTVSAGDFVYLGSFTIKKDIDRPTYGTSPLSRGSNNTVLKVDYWYGDPVVKDKETGVREFTNAMKDSLTAKGWDVSRIRTL